MKKSILLDLLVEQYPEYTREKLLAYVLCGNVYWEDERCPNPKVKFPVDAIFHIRVKKFVSRGGYKLDKAIDILNIDIKDKVMLDAGASTGGFTDCLLKRSAKYVHAVDVGYNQLAFTLRNDDRVNNLEKTNVLSLSLNTLDPSPQGAVADLSFRSLTNIVEHILSLTTEGWMLALVKPQFEYEEEDDSFTGVLKDPHAIRTTLLQVIDKIFQQGFGIQELVPSPIRGRKGNQEFIFYITKAPSQENKEYLINKVDLLLKDFSA
ncbi:TlyA family RNA methyltransferase [Spirochaeta cellobiosiphila]|uniref:TlyA family RNA methyltransferase n=1 Tax=Spirochaeta cellobiosiphila TaxID=504483 RepID=UPI00040E5BCA|nr:TlyA family RNA methyltransferase [Spirochaeta cellobiosiphila]